MREQPPSRWAEMLADLARATLVAGLFWSLRRATRLRQVEIAFLTGASHNLRTPLTAMRAGLQTLTSAHDQLAPADKLLLFQAVTNETLGRRVTEADQLVGQHGDGRDFVPAQFGGVEVELSQRLRRAFTYPVGVAASGLAGDAHVERDAVQRWNAASAELAEDGARAQVVDEV